MCSINNFEDTCGLMVENFSQVIIYCFVGEEDVRVLTLAEKIIAALPERIKREKINRCSSLPPPSPTPLSLLEDPLTEPMVIFL